MATLTTELLVRILDGATRPAKEIANAIRGIGNAQQRVNQGAPLGQRLAQAAQDTNRSLDAMRGRMLDAVAAGYALKQALTAPVQAAAEFEGKLEDIGQKANIPIDKLPELGQKIRDVAKDTNQLSSAIAEAVDNLVGLGASEQVALDAAAPIGKAATAYNAATEDLAQASYAAVNNLKVPSAQIGEAIDAMAAAGKEGAFELKDMAQYFPSLGAQYQRLGQTGVDSVADLAAALQAVRMGTGDASSAATNLGNVLQKVYANDTIKNFKKMGIDIREAMADAAEEGMTPIEAIANITNDALEGDLSRMGELFADAQVQGGLTSLIQNLEEYKRIRDVAMDSKGVVDEDFLRRIQTAQGLMQRWNYIVEQLNLNIGDALVPALHDLADIVIPIVEAIGDFARAHPELTANLIAATAAVIAFRVALTGLQFLGLMGKAGALSLLAASVGNLATAFGKAKTAASGAVALQTSLAALSGVDYTKTQKLGDAIGGIARLIPGLGGLAPIITGVATAMAGISAPVWGGIALAAAAIGAAGALIWKYWDRLTSIFSGVGSVIGDLLAPAFEKFKPLTEWMAPFAQELGRSFGEAGEKLREFGEWIGSFFSRETLTEAQKKEMYDAGRAWAQSMVDGAKEIIMDLVEWFKGLPGMILGAIGKIDLGSVFGWNAPTITPNPGNAVVNGREDPGLPAPVPVIPKAAGGNTQRGRQYLIGESEPEILTAGQNSRIDPISQVAEAARHGAASAKGGSGGGFNATLVIQGNVYGVDDLKRHFDNFMADLQNKYRAYQDGQFSDAGSA